MKSSQTYYYEKRQEKKELKNIGIMILGAIIIALIII